MLFPLKDASQDIVADSGHLPTINAVFPPYTSEGSTLTSILCIRKGHSDAQPLPRAYG